MQYYQSVFSSLPVIETARLRLRPLTMRDDRDMFRYASDPEVSRHVLWEARASPRETRSVLRAGPAFASIVREIHPPSPLSGSAITA